MTTRPMLSGSGCDGPATGISLLEPTDGDLAGMRYERWKLVLLEAGGNGLRTSGRTRDFLRLPKLFDLRIDPSSWPTTRPSASAMAHRRFSAGYRARPTSRDISAPSRLPAAPGAPAVLSLDPVTVEDGAVPRNQ